MTFRTRNAYYLRIASNNVLPLYLYLDERHLEWMSDRVLQHVLADLRPLIIPKLRIEADVQLGSGGPANAKKGTVDVMRGDSYQFAYFLRKTEPHSVLIKTRTFTTAPPQPKQTQPPRNEKTKKSHRGKRKPNESPEHAGKGRKKSKNKGKARARTAYSEDDEQELIISSDDDSILNEPNEVTASDTLRRRSGRTRKVVAGGYAENDAKSNEDVEMEGVFQAPIEPRTTTAPPELHVDGSQMLTIEQNLSREASTAQVKEEDEGEHHLANPPDDRAVLPSSAGSFGMEIDVDEEEAKPKPLLNLHYQGFNIFGSCLCVVVEPWPPVREASRAPSVAPIFSNTPRAPSIAPPDFISSGQRETMQREKTPLFLPDLDRGRSETPAPFNRDRQLPPVPLFNDTVDQELDNSDDDGLMEFSQALNHAGDHGATEADDEMDGAIFFGDADEAREF